MSREMFVTALGRLLEHSQQQRSIPDVEAGPPVLAPRNGLILALLDDERSLGERQPGFIEGKEPARRTHFS